MHTHTHKHTHNAQGDVFVCSWPCGGMYSIYVCGVTLTCVGWRIHMCDNLFWSRSPSLFFSFVLSLSCCLLSFARTFLLLFFSFVLSLSCCLSLSHSLALALLLLSWFISLLLSLSLALSFPCSLLLPPSHSLTRSLQSWKKWWKPLLTHSLTHSLSHSLSRARSFCVSRLLKSWRKWWKRRWQKRGKPKIWGAKRRRYKTICAKLVCLFFPFLSLFCSWWLDSCCADLWVCCHHNFVTAMYLQLIIFRWRLE